jgi:outer membrane protein assembly factor BamD
MNKFLSIVLFSILLGSCSEYQKAIKNEDVAAKFAVAKTQYDKGKYSKAIRLFEQVAPQYRGKPQAENMFYMFAQSYYKTNQFYLSGYQFESFASSYPKSEKVEECAYLGAKSYSELSPVYSIDQEDTSKAITKLQDFIDKYPTSTYLPEANTTLKTLTEKIEKKVFENAKQYNTISDYKAALIALDNFIADFPGTSLKEEALFYKLDSAYNLAVNSVPSKMQERLDNAKIAYNTLIKFNPNSSKKSSADSMLSRIENNLKQFQIK